MCVHRLYILPIGAGGGDCDWNGIATIGCDRSTCGAWVMGPIGDIISHELGHNVGFNHASTDVNNDGVRDIEYAVGVGRGVSRGMASVCALWGGRVGFAMGRGVCGV